MNVQKNIEQLGKQFKAIEKNLATAYSRSEASEATELITSVLEESLETLPMLFPLHGISLDLAPGRSGGEQEHGDIHLYADPSMKFPNLLRALPHAIVHELGHTVHRQWNPGIFFFNLQENQHQKLWMQTILEGVAQEATREVGYLQSTNFWPDFINPNEDKPGKILASYEAADYEDLVTRVLPDEIADLLYNPPAEQTQEHAEYFGGKLKAYVLGSFVVSNAVLLGGHDFTDIAQLTPEEFKDIAEKI